MKKVPSRRSSYFWVLVLKKFEKNHGTLLFIFTFQTFKTHIRLLHISPLDRDHIKVQSKSQKMIIDLWAGFKDKLLTLEGLYEIISQFETLAIGKTTLVNTGVEIIRKSLPTGCFTQGQGTSCRSGGKKQSSQKSVSKGSRGYSIDFLQVDPHISSQQTNSV